VNAIQASCVVLVGLALIVLGPCCVVVSIPPGHVGVVRSLGEVSDQTLSSGGPYFVKPWKHVERMSIQTVKNEEQATVPTKNGLSVKMTAVMLYKLDSAKATAVYRDLGKDYEKNVVEPYFRNAVRDVCAEFDPESMYTADRQKVETGILKRVTKDLGERGFIVEQVMLQDPVLPDVVNQRIQAKVGAEQDALRMQSILQQKRLEAEAKIVEAEGIAKAQTIVKKDLDEQYLRYMWIQALRENHAATIYVPTGHDGMPMFGRVKDAPGVNK